MERIPGIQSASLAATVPPLDWSSRVSIFYEGQVPPLDYYRGHEFEVGIRVDMNTVAPNYFKTMGIPILRGRDFTERDKTGSTAGGDREPTVGATPLAGSRCGGQAD